MGERRQQGEVSLLRRSQAPGPGSASAYLATPEGRLARSGSLRAPPSDPGPHPRPRWAEGVSGCGHPQNQHWISFGPE